MPRRPRMDVVGSYHIVNRGVDKRVVYKDEEDYQHFLELLCAASLIYEVKVHSYVLMRNIRGQVTPLPKDDILI